MSAQLRHQFGGEGGVVAEFALLDVGKAVARTVFIVETDQAAGFVVMVAESMAQRIGTSGRQTVLAVFVGAFGSDC